MSILLKTFQREDNSIRWHNVAFIGGLIFDLIIQYIIVIYCGTTMNSKMQEKLASFSVANRKLQEQLFKTLILQITIPSIIFHLPFVPVLCAPLFNLEFDFESGMIYCLFSLYPSIDSIILMSVVQDYRQEIKSECLETSGQRLNEICLEFQSIPSAISESVLKRFTQTPVVLF